MTGRIREAFDKLTKSKPRKLTGINLFLKEGHKTTEWSSLTDEQKKDYVERASHMTAEPKPEKVLEEIRNAELEEQQSEPEPMERTVAAERTSIRTGDRISNLVAELEDKDALMSLYKMEIDETLTPEREVAFLKAKCMETMLAVKEMEKEYALLQRDFRDKETELSELRGRVVPEIKHLRQVLAEIESKTQVV